MLLTLVDDAPVGDEWIHEIKYDGYRTIVAADGAQTKAFTRNGHDWSAKYAPIVEAARDLSCKSAILDGELIVQDEDGLSNFKALRSAIRASPERLALMAFDLLMLDGRDLRQQPLLARRQRLQELVGSGHEGRIHFSTHTTGDGPTFFKAADAMGLEGIVSKRVDSTYASVRSREWLKTKTFAVSDYEVLGVERSRTGIPVALLARGDQYVGNAMIALSDEDRAAFWARIDALGTPKARL